MNHGSITNEVWTLSEQSEDDPWQEILPHMEMKRHSACAVTKSWIHVGDLQFGVSRTCSVVLPTGELMVMGGMFGDRFRANVLKVAIKGITCLVI